jgi:hypothetical protein
MFFGSSSREGHVEGATGTLRERNEFLTFVWTREGETDFEASRTQCEHGREIRASRRTWVRS